MPDNKEILERLIIPKQYSSPPIIKAWFMEGAHDAMHGRVASNEHEMTQRMGAAAAQAYQAGFRTARDLKNRTG